MKAIVVENCGGPEVLLYRDAEKPTLKAGEALVKLEAVGLNYIDIYHRTGLYPLQRPFIPGSEAAGVVLHWPQYLRPGVVSSANHCVRVFDAKI